VKVVTAR